MRSTGVENHRSTLPWMACSAAQKMIPEGTNHRASMVKTSFVLKRDPRMFRRRSLSTLMRLRISRLSSVRIKMTLVIPRNERRTELVR